MFWRVASNTLWLFNIAMEKNPFIDDFSQLETSMYKGFSMAMLNNQRVIQGLEKICCRKCQVLDVARCC
jgi:hypothetical protein